jgi:hypothetical protein
MSKKHKKIKRKAKKAARWTWKNGGKEATIIAIRKTLVRA